MERNKETIARYFSAWERQDASNLDKIFAAGALYAVKPFSIEEYRGIDAIVQYWKDNTIAKQVRPRPSVIKMLVDDESALVEWQCDYGKPNGEQKQMRGMMALEFEDGLIKELREHYATHVVKK